MQRRNSKTWLIILAAVVGLVIILSLPPVWSRAVYYSREAYTTVKYWLRPPQKAVFVPSSKVDSFVATSVAATMTAIAPTFQPTTQLSATPTPSPLRPTPSPTTTPTALPSTVYLGGVTCEPQMWNNCGPATLSMYLSFYDWGKKQTDAADVLKPNPRDKNVMPYEMVDFVNENTAEHALWRYGGDLQTIKTLLAAGFPVMVEKGFEPENLPKEGWMGHFSLVVGYDDAAQVFMTQDSYYLIHPPGGGTAIPDTRYNDFRGFEVSYSSMEKNWLAFNYVFIVVYPPNKENDVLNALGPLATDYGAYQVAYNRALQETATLTDIREKFFAWYNAGTSLVYLKDYPNAAKSYDTAFSIYPDIPEASRPWRMLWYQTGPYFAYYYSGRYQDVINLADKTLDNMSEPILEESYYWRGLSYYSLGESDKAVADWRSCVKYHEGFTPCVVMLEQLGETP